MSYVLASVIALLVVGASTIFQFDNQISGEQSAITGNLDAYFGLPTVTETTSNGEVVGFSIRTAVCVLGNTPIKNLGWKELPITISILDSSAPNGKLVAVSPTSTSSNNIVISNFLKSVGSRACSSSLTYSFGKVSTPDVMKSYNSAGMRVFEIVFDQKNVIMETNEKNNIYRCTKRVCKQTLQEVQTPTPIPKTPIPTSTPFGGAPTLPTPFPTPVQSTISPTYKIETMAGNLEAGFADGVIGSAKFNGVSVIVADKDGNLYIYEKVNHVIRKITPQGVQTIAGSGTVGFSGDGGLAVNAQFNFVEGLVIDSQGNIYIADQQNHRIRKLTPNGIGGYIASTVAGTGTSGFSGDGGPATAANIYFPTEVAVDSSNNIYFADSGNHKIRKIDVKTGIIGTVAGTGTPGFSGDGGLATQAQLNRPWEISIDNKNDIYISDFGNYRIRKIDRTGKITTIAGTGTSGFSGDGGPAVNAQFRGVIGIVIDSSGNVYLVDRDNQRIRKLYLNQDGSYIISTIVGNSTEKDRYGKFVGGFSGDGGPPESAQLKSPYAITIDKLNNLYIADFGNNRIRKVSAVLPSPTTTPTPTISPPPQLRCDFCGPYCINYPQPPLVPVCSSAKPLPNTECTVVGDTCRQVSSLPSITPTPTSVANDLELRYAIVADNGVDVKFYATVCVHGNKNIVDYMVDVKYPGPAFPLTWYLVDKSGKKSPLPHTAIGPEIGKKSGDCSTISYTLPYDWNKKAYRETKRLDIEIGHSLIVESNKNNNKLYCDGAKCSVTQPIPTPVQLKKMTASMLTAGSPKYFITRGVQYVISIGNGDPVSGTVYITVKDPSGNTFTKVGQKNPSVASLNELFKDLNKGFSVKVTYVSPTIISTTPTSKLQSVQAILEVSYE